MVTRSSPNVVKFPTTVKAVIKTNTAANAPVKAKDYYIRDEMLNGFHVRVRSSGKKTYGAESKMPKTQEKVYVSLGDINLLTEKEARRRATEVLLKIKDNIDPRIERLASSGSQKNLLEVLQEYIASRESPLAPRTIDGYQYCLEQFFNPLSLKPVATLRKEHFLDWYQLAKKNPAAAQKTFTIARTILRFAEAMGYIDDNPAERAKTIIGKFKRKHSIKPFIPFNELHKFLSAYTQCSQDKVISHAMRDYILLILVTGFRREEAQSLKWEQVNFEKKTISLPDNKAKRYFEIPMTHLTHDLLKWRLENTKKSNYVFASSGRTGHIVEPKRAFKKIADKAKLSHNLNSHALRRTFATICKELDISLDDSGKLLNHANRNVTDSYVSRSLEYQRGLYDQVIRKIESRVENTIDGQKVYGAYNGFRVFFYGADEGWYSVELEPENEDYWNV